MAKTKISGQSIADLLWKACDPLRDTGSVQDSLQIVLDVLLWSHFVPETEGSLVGYFDTMRSLNSDEEWEHIQSFIRVQCGLEGDQYRRSLRLKPRIIEGLRVGLLPLARIVNSGDRDDCVTLTKELEALQVKLSGRIGGEYSIPPAMGALWSAFIALHKDKDVECIYPQGVAAAPFLAPDHTVTFCAANTGLAQWVRGLISLLPTNQLQKPGEVRQTWPVAIAAPPFAFKSRDLLVQDSWFPGELLDCPSAIRDTEARRIYAAHQKCTDTTYALVSPGIAFKSSKDLEYFRSELLRENWLHAVVSLPSGVLSSAAIGGLLLVLKKERPVGQPILMVSADFLQVSSKGRLSKGEWDESQVDVLVKIVADRAEGESSRLVTKEEIADNGFSLQVDRYLQSEADVALEEYLRQRNTLQLGDLAEIKRPLATLSRHSEDGVDVWEITPSDIDESGIISSGSKEVRIDEAVLSKSRDQFLEDGDVLLSIKGGLGKVAMVNRLDRKTLPGQAFCVIRLRPNAPITPTALVQYLRSSVGKALLNRNAQGTAVSFIPMGEIKSLQIVMPNQKELENSLEIDSQKKSLSEEIKQLTDRLQKLCEEGWLSDAPALPSDVSTA